MKILKKNFFSCFDMFRFNNDTVVHQQSGSNLFVIMFEDLLKVVSASFLLVCFKKSTCETTKNVFYFDSKALFVLKKSKFRTLDIQISRRHQIFKHEEKNTFY